jgi:hypothetical protein
MLPACSEYSVTKGKDVIGDNTGDGEPDIEVSPTEALFGPVAVNDTVAHVQNITVSNVGDASLEIYSLALEDTQAPFELSAIGSVLVAPGQSTSFTVTYAPFEATAAETNALIQSNDPDEEFSLVLLAGTGVAPKIEVSPEVYDFGTNYIGCEAQLPIEIKNTGNADLEITDLAYISASNDLGADTNEVNNGELPWTIPPSGTMTVYVAYNPMDDIEDDGYLQIDSNDPTRPQVQAVQTGLGAVYDTNIDSYEQPIKGSSDILFIIDNSCSMGDEQANLQANFDYFSQEIGAMDLDFQMAIITTDNPSFRGDIMTKDTNNLEGEFVAQSSVGTGGSGTEMPTEMAYQSTQNGGDAGPGSAFLRDDAMLSMIFVSDEPDSSPSNWASYLSYFQSIKSTSDDYIAHAISGDYPSGCGGASYTNNVYELTVATGGLFLSVCATDWSSHLEVLAEGSAADLSSFELTEWPVPETIVVRLDGVTTTTGWTYVGPDNAVDFEESAIPEGGTTIEIEYDVAGGCGD